jgi:DNA-binding response OmpR family regulator
MMASGYAIDAPRESSQSISDRVLSVPVIGCDIRPFIVTAPTAMKRVLLVEDDAATRKGYGVYLTNCGFDVIEAADGHQGLLLASTSQPDIIVLDLGLPDIDGWEVARQLKKDAQTATIPILALTGSDLPHERVSAMRAGCDRHLAKPCEPGHLVATIRLCVGDGT